MYLEYSAMMLDHIEATVRVAQKMVQLAKASVLVLKLQIQSRLLF